MSTLRRAAIVGFPYYASMLARLVNERSATWSMTHFSAAYFDKVRALIESRRIDALVCFGGPGPDAFFREIARRRGVPVVVIWAGTDVLTATQDPGLLEIVKQDRNVNISDGPWLVDELRGLGVDATYVPVTAIDAVAEPKPLPERFRVVSVLPEPRRAFYGEKAVYSIAREFPDIRFTVVGKGARNPVAPSNVEFLGYIDQMPSLLDASSVLLRMPKHDGKSMIVLEALARGRHVIWTYDFPGVQRVDSISSAISQLAALVDAHTSGTLEPNTVGLEHVRATFGKSQIIESFTRTLDEAVNARAHSRHRSRKVAISGFNLFAAQVAGAVEESGLDWKPHVLRGGGRLERLTSMGLLADADVWYRIGSPVPDRWLSFVSTALRKPRVMHWVGSDVLALKRDPAVRKRCLREKVTHLAEVDWIIDELKDAGIRAKLAPLPPHVSRPPSIPPMPSTFTVLLYLPRSRGDFYGRREYERLIRTFAHEPVRFLVVGGGEMFYPQEADVQMLGWRTDLREIYERTSVLIRFTQHDGLSLMALEALTYGRRLIWTQDFPFALRADGYVQLEQHVRALLAEHRAGVLAPATDAARYISETYGVSSCIERISRYWEASTTSAVAPMDTVTA